jgi:hypothetical protein
MFYLLFWHKIINKVMEPRAIQKGELFRVDGKYLAVNQFTKDPGSVLDNPSQETEMIFKIIKGPRKDQVASISTDEFYRLQPLKRRDKKRIPDSFFPPGCSTCGTTYPDYRGPGVECPGCGSIGESFKEWILLREMSAAVLKNPVPTEEGLVDSIDLRFEDYPKGTEEERNILRRLMSREPYFGQFPGGEKYLVFDGENADIDVEPSRNPDYIELPSDWWDIAAGYLGNELVKKPKKLRVYD